MSVFNEEQIAVMVRQRLRLPPDAALELQPIIPSALNALAVQVAGNFKLRQWLLTDPASTTATLGATGETDLSTLITSDNILIEFIRNGNVYHPDSAYPMVWNETVDQGITPGPYDQMYLHCWLQGTTLFTRSLDSNATYLTGDVSLAIPYVPTLAQLPEALVDNLVATIASLVIKPSESEAAA